MKSEEVFNELVDATGEWDIPEYIKIVNGQMIGTAKHEFDLVCYTYKKGETFLRITIEERDKEFNKLQ